MDVLIVIIIACCLCIKGKTEEQIPDIIVPEGKREVRRNPNYCCDENAFMEVANNLGFYSAGHNTNTPDSMWRS